MEKRNIYITVAIVIIIGISLLGYAMLKNEKSVGEKEGEMKKISLRLKWLDQAQFAGFYMARKEGFYAKSGLDVEIYPGGPDISPLQMVTTGVDDFGITSADQIILARGKGVPVVALAVIFKQSPIA